MLPAYLPLSPLLFMKCLQGSGMMRKALTVYETYVEMMNDDIRKVFQVCERCGTFLGV